MKPHIRNRNDLINYILDHEPYKAIGRAIEEGDIENFGAFTSLVNFTKEHGWIVKITSKAKKTWYLAVVADTGQIWIVYNVSWGSWVGEMYYGNLNRGDNPKIYKEKKDLWVNQKTQI